MDGHQGLRVDVEPDTWLAAIFGCPVLKVSFPAVTTEATIPLLEGAIFREVKPAFYYAKLSTRRVAEVSALTRLGFSVVDVNVTLERSPSTSCLGLQQRSVPVRDSLPQERPAILEIAESCFVYSRFHLDPQVPNEVANAVKRAWVDNYCLHKRGDRLLAAEVDGHPVGFLAVNKAKVGEQRVQIIDLIGVHRDYQRRGVGLSLVESFIRESCGDTDLLRVGTQAVNIPSIALYEKCGFHVVETAYMLHAHV